MIVVDGPASNGLGAVIANVLNTKYVKLEHKLFPDGESYIRYPINVKDEDVVLIQSAYHPQDKHLIELFLMAETAKDLGAKKVIAVIPYLAYTRQDRRFLSGEPISIKTILRLLRYCGVDTLITVEIHKEDSLKYFPGKAVNVHAMKPLAEYFKSKYLNKGISSKDIIVLAPDKGALGRAKEFSSILNTDYDYLEKFRDRITGEVKVKPKSLNVSGRVVIIVDDIISTGGTVALAASNAYEYGAKEVYAVCAHALLVKDALSRLKKSGVKSIIALNTLPIPKGVEVVDISKELARAITSVL